MGRRGAPPGPSPPSDGGSDRLRPRVFFVVSLAPHAPPLGDLSQEPGGPRSPAVFGSLVSYVEQFFETVGISLADRQVRPALLSPRLGGAPLRGHHSLLPFYVHFNGQFLEFIYVPKIRS